MDSLDKQVLIIEDHDESMDKICQLMDKFEDVVILKAQNSDIAYRYAMEYSIDLFIVDIILKYRAGRVNITISAKDGSNKTKVVSVIVRPKKMSRPFGYKKSKRKAYIYWSSVSGASGYQIQYSKNKSFKKAKKRRITKRSYVTISKLARKKYYVRVRAYVKSKKKYYYGAWSNRKIINMRKN